MCADIVQQTGAFALCLCRNVAAAAGIEPGNCGSVARLCANEGGPHSEQQAASKLEATAETVDVSATLLRILRLVLEVQQQQCDLMQRVQRIEENMQRRSDRQTDTGSARLSSPLLPPLTLALQAYTVEALESAEAAIEDESVAAGLLKQLVHLGGKGLKQVAANIMTAIMGVAVQRLYSLHGRKGKNSFISLKLCKGATDAIYEKMGVDVAEAQGFIRKWLPGSVDRGGGRKGASLKHFCLTPLPVWQLL
ncbi:uncharacterized protein LOC144116283 [Amblyomma americanum]